MSPSAPIFLRFNMPPDLDVALLKLTSGDTRCMTLSVQNLTCPVYDLDTNVLFEGMWQVLIYRAGRPIIRKVLKIIIWVVPPVCLGSR